MKYRAGRIEFSDLSCAYRYSESLGVKVEILLNGEWQILSNLYPKSA
jgi:hypothetical protein